MSVKDSAPHLIFKEFSNTVLSLEFSDRKHFASLFFITRLWWWRQTWVSSTWVLALRLVWHEKLHQRYCHSVVPAMQWNSLGFLIWPTAVRHVVLFAICVMCSSTFCGALHKNFVKIWLHLITCMFHTQRVQRRSTSWRTQRSFLDMHVCVCERREGRVGWFKKPQINPNWR